MLSPITRWNGRQQEKRTNFATLFTELEISKDRHHKCAMAKKKFLHCYQETIRGIESGHRENAIPHSASLKIAVTINKQRQLP